MRGGSQQPDCVCRALASQAQPYQVTRHQGKWVGRNYAYATTPGGLLRVISEETLWEDLKARIELIDRNNQ